MALINRSMSFVHLLPALPCPNSARCLNTCPRGPNIFLERPARPICQALITNVDVEQGITRRTANFQPNLWDYNSLQSLTNGFQGEKHMVELEKMKKEVKDLIIDANQINPMVKLELIDAIQRLGLQYQFEAEIKQALDEIWKRSVESQFSNDLHATTLLFRLLRQHGYNVPQDVFESFMNEDGNFRECLCEDMKGLLGLYEASFHGLKGDVIIDKAMEFSLNGLKAMEKNKLLKDMAVKVERALDMPIHWRPNRLEARWFIDVYEKQPDMNPTLLKLAKLDFNRVQSIYMDEVQEMSRWWVGLGLTGMNFFRDRLLEHYLWSMFTVFEPQYRASRVMKTKIISMITAIDDVYDVYGLMEELELLTDFIDRWDINGIDKLPHMIKTIFLALYNTTNEIGHGMMIERGINIIPYLRKAWADQCKAYLVEAKWYHKGLKPSTLKEYLDTAALSIGGWILLLCSFLATSDALTEPGLAYILNSPRIMFSSCLIVRLNNDLATSTDELARGDNLKSVECYMNETGESEEAAWDHVKHLVRETWKIMNEDKSNTHDYPQNTGAFVDACLNLARASQSFYQYGDGHGRPGEKTKEHLLSVLIQPIPID